VKTAGALARGGRGVVRLGEHALVSSGCDPIASAAPRSAARRGIRALGARLGAGVRDRRADWFGRCAGPTVARESRSTAATICGRLLSASRSPIAKLALWGTKSELLCTLVAASNVESAVIGVRSSVLKWRPLAGFARSVALSFCKLASLANKNWRARKDSNL
jgi:hypothetical protein